MDRYSAEQRWRHNALVATTALAEQGEDTTTTDFAAADAGAYFIIEHIVEPLVRSLDGMDDLPAAVRAALQNAKGVL